MNLRAALRRPLTWLIAIPVVLLLLVVGGPFVYINFIKDDPPPRLTFEDSAATTEATVATSSASSPAATTAGTTGTTASATTTATADGSGDLAGTWTVAEGSQAGYRVDEVLFGQDTEGVGRTSDVTGQFTLDGTTVAAADFTVDMTTVTSDESRRDGQFRDRIMDTDTFPTATFTLTEPIDLGTLPPDGEQVTVSVTGEFTIRGVSNNVTFDLLARRNGDAIEVNGTIPVTFADYDIPDASFGPATVKDNGEIEFLLTLAPAS